MANEKSAGAILLSSMNGIFHILLVEHRDNTYVFPKGHIKAGESPEEAAVREIREETGFSKFQLGRRLGVVTRRSEKADGTVVTKDIIIFLAFVDEDEHEPHGEESARWFTAEDAPHHLRYDEDRALLLQHLDEIMQAVKNNPDNAV